MTCTVRHPLASPASFFLPYPSPAVPLHARCILRCTLLHAVLPCMQIFVGSMEAPLLFSPFVCAASVRCCTLAGWVAPTSPPAPSLGPQPTHSRDILLPKTHPHRFCNTPVCKLWHGRRQKAACAGAGGRPAKAWRAAACTRTNPGCAAPNAFWTVIHTFTHPRWPRWRPLRSVRPRLVASGLLPALPAPFGNWERSAMQLCTATSGHATLCCRSQKPGALGGLGAAAGACAGWIVNSAYSADMPACAAGNGATRWQRRRQAERRQSRPPLRRASWSRLQTWPPCSSPSGSAEGWGISE